MKKPRRDRLRSTAEEVTGDRWCSGCQRFRKHCAFSSTLIRICLMCEVKRDQSNARAKGDKPEG